MHAPVIVEKEQLYLLGVGFFGDPFASSAGWTEENEIGRLWNRFSAYLKEHKELMNIFCDPSVGYEVHIEHAETRLRGHYEVFVGMEVKSLDHVPCDLLVKVLPAATYAVFTLQGEEMVSDWEHEITAWLKTAGYKQAYPYGFQYLDKRFKGIHRISESELDAYVPIQPESHE